jgi:hypothetical protein
MREIFPKKQRQEKERDTLLADLVYEADCGNL